MAQDASQRWNRTDGVLIAPGTTPEAVADAFAERGVVVRLEWFPATTHLLSLTLMTDVEGRVAVTPPSRGGVVPGPSVSELVESLARQFTADVAVGPATFNALPDDVELPSISHHGSASARTVVISPMSAYMVPLQATLLERPLAVASTPSLDRRIVMYSGEGTELGTFGWDEESLPALVLTSDSEDMSIRAIPTGDPEDDAVFSWGMTSRYVWGGVKEPGPALRSLVDELLADLTDASGIVDAVPGADLEAAVDIIVNAKTQRVGVCNAAETLLVHADVAATYLPAAARALWDKDTVLHADPTAHRILTEAATTAGRDVLLTQATEADWDTEYGSLDLAVRVVKSLEEAIDHIRAHTTGHTEAVLAQDVSVINDFIAGMDSAAIMVNASTRFTDGGQLGLGAELGISTQKLHARGPMGLSELTTTTWIVEGDGHIRP